MEDRRLPSFVFMVERIRLHIQTFHHEAQQGPAFTEAGRIEMSVLADFGRM